MTWRCFIDDRPLFAGLSRVFLAVDSGGLENRSLASVEPLAFTVQPRHSEAQPTLELEAPELDDFLQMWLDAAWERGLRPKGFVDHAGELGAVRAHLEDMRRLIDKRKITR